MCIRCLSAVRGGVCIRCLVGGDEERLWDACGSCRNIKNARFPKDTKRKQGGDLQPSPLLRRVLRKLQVAGKLFVVVCVHQLHLPLVQYTGFQLAVAQR